MQNPDEAIVSERLGRNRLLPGTAASSAAEVVAGLCGVQAQELPAARLAIRVRSTGLTDADVEAARVEDRSILRTWAMRGTLHLVAAEDWDWLRSLTGPMSIRSNARRSSELGLDEGTYRRALQVTEKALAGGAQLTRAEWKVALAGRGIDASGQRAPYLLARASAEGLICEGQMRGGKPTYVLLDDWLGLRKPAPGDRDDALLRLVNRYLDAYGPATPEDLAAWSGLGITECREAFRRAEPDLAEVPIGGRRAWTSRTGASTGGSAGVRLLPSYDTFLLGYRDRTLHLDPEHAAKVNAGGGIVRSVVLVEGRVRGNWKFRRQGKRAAIEVSPFEPATKLPSAEIAAEVADIGRFLDLPVELL